MSLDLTCKPLVVQSEYVFAPTLVGKPAYCRLWKIVGPLILYSCRLLKKKEHLSIESCRPLKYGQDLFWKVTDLLQLDILESCRPSINTYYSTRFRNITHNIGKKTKKVFFDWPYLNVVYLST